MMTTAIQEQVVLVNEQDEALGAMEKMEAHRTASLHRAFSVFVFDDRGRLLLQQRAEGKYHSGGLWTNTCCGHPRPGEEIGAAAKRRLNEEMNILIDMEPRFRFLYRAALDNELHEHELDHVFFARFSGIPRPDPSEVMAWRYVPVAEVDEELTRDPDRYTVWFQKCWNEVREHLER